MPTRLWLIVIVTLAVEGPTLTAQQPPAPTEVRQRILDTWRALFPKVRSVINKEEKEYYKSTQGRPYHLHTRQSVRWEVDESGILFAVESSTFDDSTKVIESYSKFEINNEKYSAELGRAPNGNSWMLKNMKMGRNPPGDEPFLDKAAALVWTTVGNVPLYRWVQDPSFEIVRIEPSPPQVPAEIVRVHFVCVPDKRIDKGLPWHIPSGYIDFDPAHSYRPTSYLYQRKSAISAGTDRGTFEYADQKDHFVLKRKIEEAEANGEKLGSIKSKSVYDYDITYNSDLPTEQFRLSYYGLPEPVTVEWPKRTSPWRWIVGGALAAFVLAVLFRHLHRRSLRLKLAKA